MTFSKGLWRFGGKASKVFPIFYLYEQKATICGLSIRFGYEKMTRKRIALRLFTRIILFCLFFFLQQVPFCRLRFSFFYGNHVLCFSAFSSAGMSFSLELHLLFSSNVLPLFYEHCHYYSKKGASRQEKNEANSNRHAIFLYSVVPKKNFSTENVDI